VSERQDVKRDESFERAFRDVFEARFQSLFRYVNRLCGDPATAADIAQESFVRLYQRGELPDDPRAWLVTVSNNLFRDAYRRTGRRQELLEVKADRLYDETASDPIDRLEADERKRQVRTALATLSVRDQQALLLRHEGYTYREIARALDYGEAGVGKLISRATRAFQRAYEEMVDASA
jgi:RNA polymerase sigma factor (sigma-70 family)